MSSDSYPRRRVLAWALYDWGNSAFATVIIAGFFPVFFKQFWSEGIDATVSTFRLGVASSAASLVVLVLAPVLGAIADQGDYKKRFLGFFASLGVLMTALLALVGQGHWELAAALYALGGVGFATANVFYDALILDVAPRQRLEQVSALGYALGYLGGGLLFALCVLMTVKPAWFGLADAGAAVRASFVLTAIWWAAFALPLLLTVREQRRGERVRGAQAVRAGLRQLRQTLGKVRRYRVVGLFLLAYWLYIDAVDTIIRMAVDYGMALGFPSEGLITALLITQFVGFPAAVAFGWLGGRIGPRNGIFLGLLAYAGITVWGYWMEHEWEFYALAVAVGLVQGGVQALSRSLYARLIPAAEAGEFFGFYNLVGKFAAVLGPALMGWVALATGDTRVSILSLLILFSLGAVLLVFVDGRAGGPSASPSAKGVG